jgi:hypothetical protein
MSALTMPMKDANFLDQSGDFSKGKLKSWHLSSFKIFI